MQSESGFWGASIKPDEPFSLSPPLGWIIRVSSAAFSLDTENIEKADAAIVIEENGSSYVVSRLGGGQRSVSLDLFFAPGTSCTLKVIGNSSVDITGYKTPHEEDQSDGEGDDMGMGHMGQERDIMSSLADELDIDGSESETEPVPSGATLQEITGGDDEGDEASEQPQVSSLSSAAATKSPNPILAQGKGKKQKRDANTGATPTPNKKAKTADKPEEKKGAKAPVKTGPGKQANPGAKPGAAKVGGGTISAVKCDFCTKTFTNEKSKEQHVVAKHKDKTTAPASAST